MEKALRKALVAKVTELKDSVYPTNAPETAARPYLVYYRTNTNKLKALDGHTDKQELRFIYSIMATDYSKMKTLTENVEDFLIGLQATTISNLYVENITINNIQETYEFELNINRGIIDFTIFY